jgi:hypothetical protein
MAAPVMTFNAAGNVRASATLAAGGTFTAALDFSTKVEGQVTVVVTNGAAIAASHGLQVDFWSGYGTTVAYTNVGAISAMVGQSVNQSSVQSMTFYVPTGKYQIRGSNTDFTNAITVEVTSATIDSYA